MDNEIDRKIDVTAILFLLVQNRQQTHDWILIRSAANELDIEECKAFKGTMVIRTCPASNGEPFKIAFTGSLSIFSI